MKICLVTQQLGHIHSGPGVYANNVLNRLIRDKHEVTVLSLQNQFLENASNYSFVGIKSHLFGKSQARWMGLSVAFGRSLSRLEKNTAFDIVHFTDVREALFCRTSSPKLANINDPYSAILHSTGYYRIHYHDWFYRWGYYHLVHIFESLYLPKLDALIANSDYTARNILNTYPVNDKQLFTIYKSVDNSQFEPALKFRKSKHTGSINILMVGSNLQRKGIRTLINAAPKIILSLSNVRFIIVGSDPAIPVLRALCKKYQVEEYFDFMGHQNRIELLDTFAEAKIFVMPALIEAFGVAILEAMASGVPVIGTNVGGIPEIITNGINGILIPPDDSNSLSEAVIDLIKDDKLQLRLMSAGLETAKRFNVDLMMNETYKIYDKFVESKIFD